MLRGISNREAALRAVDDKICREFRMSRRALNVLFVRVRTVRVADLIVHRLAQTSYCGCLPI